MGHHYVPQRHLRRFEIPEKPKTIWMYDKKFGQFKEVPIKNTAQERDYYAQGLRILSRGDLQEQSLQVVVVPASLLAFAAQASGKLSVLRQNHQGQLP